MDSVGVGIIGSGFIAEIHAESLRRVPNAALQAVASPTPGKAAAFAARHSIPQAFEDYRHLVALPGVDLVILCLPNDQHCEATELAASAGKHVLCEKPLCITLAEADRMIAVCRRAGVQLMYAEELCFTPKYVRAKQLADEGALGDLYLVKQSEKHDGPHADWFWDVSRSGGGVTLDMGCHAIEFFRWVLGRPAITSVYAQMGVYVHRHRTEGDDNAQLLIEFEGGADGYGYAVEKAGSTRGWSFTMFEELWNYGFPQELQHALDCIMYDRQPMETGEDGRAVLEAIYAAYESARTGCKVSLPYSPPAWCSKPIYAWKPWLAPECPADLKRESIEWGRRTGNYRER